MPLHHRPHPHDALMGLPTWTLGAPDTRWVLLQGLGLGLRVLGPWEGRAVPTPASAALSVDRTVDSEEDQAQDAALCPMEPAGERSVQDAAQRWGNYTAGDRPAASPPRHILPGPVGCPGKPPGQPLCPSLTAWEAEAGTWPESPSPRTASTRDGGGGRGRRQAEAPQQ